MVDTIRFVVPERLVPSWLRAELDSPLAAPHAVGEAVAQRRVSVAVGNLNLRRNALGQYVGENSLHRFFKGHNGSSFTRSEVAEAIEKISVTLGFDVSECRLTKVAFGPNLTGLDVQTTLQALTDYKGKRFLKYERGKGLMGAKRQLTELELKMYDKQRELADKRQATLSSPTLRYELTSRKLSYLRKLGVTTVADLYSTKFFTAASKELEARLVACTFTEQLDTSSLLADEVEALALVESPYFAAYAANRANKDRTPRRRRLAEQARAKATLSNTKAAMLAQLKATIAELV